MSKRTPIISLFVTGLLLLGGHQARASEPEFGTVSVGAPFSGAADPSLPGSAPQPTVRVSWNNGKWTALIPDNLTLRIAFSAEMKKGYIVNYRIGDDASGNRVIHELIQDGAGEVVTVAQSGIAGIQTTTLSTTALMPISTLAMVQACNSQASAENDFEATYNYFVALQIDAKRRMRPTTQGDVGWGEFARKLVTGVVPIRIICEPPPDHVTVPFKVTGAELYLATFKGDGPVPTQGASCKVLKVTARFKTTTSGLVHFDLSHQVGGQGIKTIPITIEAKQKPDGTYAAEYVKDWFLDKATYAQFFVQETDGQGVSAGWKDINVTCNDNLADPASQPKSGEPALKVLKSKFTVTTFQNNSATGCPVDAALDVEVITNKPGGVPFKVTGTDGFVWNYSIKADQEFGPLQIGEGQAQFAKTYRRMILVTKSTDALYRLEVRNVAAEPGAKTAGPDNLKVSCGGDLTVPFAVTGTELNIVDLPGCPTTAFAAATFVTTGTGKVRYRLAATTGEVETGTAEAIKVGNRFIATAKLSTAISKGGEVVFSATPLDFPKKLALKKKPYNCGGPRPGDVSGEVPPKTHLDPKNAVIDSPKLIKPKKTLVPVIVTPTPLSCAGGVVRNDRCACPTGFNAVKAASNAYRCIRTKPALLNLPKAAKPIASPQKLRGL